MNNQIIGFTIGAMLLIIGLACLLPAMLDYTRDHHNYMAFLICASVSLFFGGALVLANRNPNTADRPLGKVLC